MKIMLLSLAFALALGVGGQAMAGGLDLWLGGNDNVTSANIMIAEEVMHKYKLTRTPFTSETGPAFVIQLAKPDVLDMCLYRGKKAPQTSQGNWKRVVMGGANGFDRVIVQMADINNFNTTHTLHCDWTVYECEVYVYAQPK